MRIFGLMTFAVVLAGCSLATDGTATTTATDLSVPGATKNTTSATAPPGDRGEPTRVLDGDSLSVRLDDGSEVEVRMLGINAPEGSECYGDQARTTLEQLLASGTVTLVSDGEDVDQFGRLLRYVYVDGLNVNLALIANGDAIVLQGDHSFDSEFATIGDAAFDNRLGMWAADACENAASAGEVKIVDYTYNPQGRDEENLNGEWVAIANRGSTPTDISGWILRDESTQNRYVFPRDTRLEPGAELLVHTGCGTDTKDDLYWCATDPIWSNGGDTVMLQTPSGTVVARERFQGDF